MAIPFKVQDILSFTHPTPVPVPHCSRQNVTMPDSRVCPCTPVTPELKGVLQYSHFPGDYALVGSDKSFCCCIYWHKYSQ